MSILPAFVADLCPICDHVHHALDEFWACPRHGHALQFATSNGERERFDCPVTGCAYHRWAPRKPRSPSKGDPMTAVETRPSTAVDAMWNRKAHIAAVLPDHIDAKSFIGTAAAALYANADLMACAERNPESLLIALMRCASLGHRPGTEEFYLTPRGLRGGKRGPEIVGIEGYRGIVERMYRSGAVATVVVREVCAKDRFQFVEGRDETPTHSFGAPHGTTGADFFGERGTEDRGEMVGVYAYAKLTTGVVSRVVLLSREDVEAARDSGGYSPTDQHSPWNRLDGGKDRPEFKGRSMWWKTAVRRLEPWVPTSAEYRRELARATAQAQAPAPAWLPPAAELNDIADADVVEPEAIERPQPKATTGQWSQINALFKGMGFEPHEEDEVYNIIAKFTGSDEPARPATLTQDQAGVVIGHLKACKGSRPALMELLTEAGDG